MSVQEGINFPRVLGVLNYPPATIRQGPLASKAMALIRGETPVHLAQRVRGQFTPIYQPPANSIFPVIPRPTPYIDQLKSRQTFVKRPKVIGYLGLLNKQIGVNGNIPGPYPSPRQWAPTRNIGNLPSVKADIRGGSGPERTLHGLSVIM